jgi:hypothetical protein
MSTQTLLQVSPYKEKHIWKKLSQVMSDDIDWVYNSFETHGIKYLICTTLCLHLSLIKCVYLFTQNFFKPECTYQNLKLSYKNINSVNSNLEGSTTILRENLEAFPLKDSYQKSKTKDMKSEAIIELRKYLYLNNFEIRGKILSKIEHKLDDETLIRYAETGNFDKPLSTTKITFGKGLDELLTKVIPSRIKLRKSKLSSSNTCLTFRDDDYGFLSEMLKNLYQENIKVIID